MVGVMRDSWALLLGVLLLMLGNGLQGTLLGVRGGIEGMGPTTISLVMSSYFLGLFAGARLVPAMIRRVGHVRVFAALASLISAAFIIYAAAPDPWVWAGMRFIVGLGFCGVYVAAESWLNAKADNATRGQAMSAYMMVQLFGVVAAQALLPLGDPSGYGLFVVISVLVSVAVAPVLLSATPAPVFESTKAMSLRRLYEVSPLGCVTALLLGAMFSALFGMSAVYGTEAGFTLGEISLFVSAIYAGGFLMQWPVGWLSDRMDRRVLIVGVCALGAAAATAAVGAGSTTAVIALAAVIGGMINPLYSLIIAYTNDFLEPDDMAAASGGLVSLNGLGAVGGPLVVGGLIDLVGPAGFFVYLAGLLGAVSVYGLYRMTQRAAPAAAETGPYAIAAMTAGAVAMEATQEAVVEQIAAAEDEPGHVDVADAGLDREAGVVAVDDGSDGDDSTPRAA